MRFRQFSFLDFFLCSDAMAISAIHVSFKTPQVFVFNFFSCADWMAISAVSARDRVHPGQPESRKRGRNLLGVKAPVLLAAKQFLHQKVINHHAQKAACRQQRIHLAKKTLADARANVSGQIFVVFGDKGVEETDGELVVFQRRKPQQAGELAITRAANQNLPGDGLKDFEIAVAFLQDLLHAIAAASRQAQLLQHGPVETLLVGERPEEQGLFHTRLFGDLPCGGAPVALAGKNSRSYYKDLLAAVAS